MTEAYLKGRHSYGKPDVVRFRMDQCVAVGNFCSTAGGVVFMVGGSHRTDWLTTFPFHAFLSEFPAEGYVAPDNKEYQLRGGIEVGSDVYIGLGVTILAGVRIGHGAVIGARAVVTRDVPPYAVAVGNPARIVHRRFADETVERLLQMAWWNWSDHKITALLTQIMCPPDVSKLEAAAIAYDLKDGDDGKDGVKFEPWYVGYGLERLGLHDVTSYVRAMCATSCFDHGRVDLPPSDPARLACLGGIDPYPNIVKHVQVRSNRYGTRIYEAGAHLSIWADGRHSSAPFDVDVSKQNHSSDIDVSKQTPSAAPQVTETKSNRTPFPETTPSISSLNGLTATAVTDRAPADSHIDHLISTTPPPN